MKTALQEWGAAVAAAERTGLHRSKAILAAARQNPELRKRLAAGETSKPKATRQKRGR